MNNKLKTGDKIIWNANLHALVALICTVCITVALLGVLLAHRETVVSCQKIPDKSGALCTIEKNIFLAHQNTAGAYL